MVGRKSLDPMLKQIPLGVSAPSWFVMEWRNYASNWIKQTHGYEWELFRKMFLGYTRAEVDSDVLAQIDVIEKHAQSNSDDELLLMCAQLKRILAKQVK